MRNQYAFTLVELLVASSILLIGIGGVFMLYIQTMNTSQNSWDSTQAVSHAQYILEDMQKRSSHSEIVSNDWDLWAQSQNLKTLPQESIKVAYVNPAKNPLQIAVQVNWIRREAPQHIKLETVLTK